MNMEFKYKYKEKHGNDKHQIQENAYLEFEECFKFEECFTGGFDCISNVSFLITI